MSATIQHISLCRLHNNRVCWPDVGEGHFLHKRILLNVNLFRDSEEFPFPFVVHIDKFAAITVSCPFTMSAITSK